MYTPLLAVYSRKIHNVLTYKCIKERLKKAGHGDGVKKNQNTL